MIAKEGVIYIYIYTHTHTTQDHSSTLRKEEILPFATMLSEISYMEKVKNHVISLTCEL